MGRQHQRGTGERKGQAVDFIVTNNNNALFSVQPGVSPDGTLAYTPAANAYGVATVTVRIHDNGGTDNGGVDTSAAQTFTITVKNVGYGFMNIKNLPPAPGVTFKPSSKGAVVDFEWKFTSGGVVVNSLDAQPSVTIQFGLTGTPRTYTPSSWRDDCTDFEYRTSEKKWDFDWRPKSTTPGTYYVIVRSGKTGQRFPETGPGFPVVFK